MSQTVIFSVGAVVFALTVWGTVMAGGIWLGQIADSEDERSGPTSGFTKRGADDVDGPPTTTSQ